METALTLSIILNILLLLLLNTSVKYNNNIYDYMLKQKDMIDNVIDKLFELIKDNKENN